MKKCPWCGKEYPDEIKVCALDHHELEPRDSATLPAPAAFEPVPEEELPWQTPFDQAVDDTGDPAEFVLLRTLEPFEADRLLDKFEAQGIPFQIDRVEQEIQNKGGVRRIGYIQVFVRRADRINADRIYTADWKV